MSNYELFAREVKTAKLVAVLRKAGITAAEARKATVHDWALVSRLADVRQPSAATIAAVIAELDK